MSELVTLFRPVGPSELALIESNGFSAFPPRLPEQPFFYPVCNLEYASEIASTWNVRDSRQGFVTRFSVDEAFLSEFDVRTVGASRHQEYWIPAERLADFNPAIVGKIEVVARYGGRQ